MPAHQHNNYMLAGPIRVAFEKCLAGEEIPTKARKYYRQRANIYAVTLKHRKLLSTSILSLRIYSRNPVFKAERRHYHWATTIDCQ